MPKRTICARARVFFVFVAGIRREADAPPILGIQRPYPLNIEQEKLSGNQVISSAGQMRMLVDDYIREMGDPTKYTDLMVSLRKDQVRFINEDDFEVDFKGYNAELRDRLESECNKLTDVEKAVQKKREQGEGLTWEEERMNRMLTDKYLQIGECLANVLSKAREDAWRQFRGLESPILCSLKATKCSVRCPGAGRARPRNRRRRAPARWRRGR